MGAVLVGCLMFFGGCGNDGIAEPGPVAIQASEQLQQSLEVTSDAYVDRQARHVNFGTDTVLKVERQGRVRSLMRIPRSQILQAIGSDSLVSAHLTLSVVANDGNWPGQGGQINLHAMSFEWVEGAVTWACHSDPDLSNNQADCATEWTIDAPQPCTSGQPGCFVPWRPTATDSFTVTNSFMGSISFDVTSDVAAMVGAGPPTNPYSFGWIVLKPQHNQAGDVWFQAREEGDGPQLVLVTETPEPPPQVPALPPDSIPTAIADEIYADTNYVSVPGVSGTYPRDVIWVTFEFAATQPQRQAAIELVGGTVVGGIPMNPGGIYVIRIPHDGSGQPVADGIAALKSLPQVRWAAPDLNNELTVNYRRPNDGSGWQTSDWQLRAGNAQGDRWGLERVAAPLAWGCSIGDAGKSVGVVDDRFDGLADLLPNVAPGSDIGLSTGFEHGTGVSSILAASGDNGIGMAGVMWHASLSLRDAGSGGPARKFQLLANLVFSGVPLINMSKGFVWTQQVGRLPATSGAQAQADRQRMENLAQAVYQAVSSYQHLSNVPAPLVVFSASNDGIDAWWSGTAQVRDSLDVGDHILVVASSDVQDNLGLLSNRNITNTLVEVAAPGEAVGALDASGSVHQLSGTSFAAPFVTGLAGLLSSFDPSLTASDLKDLIIQGAVRGGRTANGIPIINAYESLRAAAERQGAPLCGQEVFAAGGELFVRRTPGGVPEKIATVPDPVGRLEVLHGGKAIRFLTLQGAQSLAWDPVDRDWDPATVSGDSSGTKRSLFGTSHDGDTLAFVDNSTVATRWYDTQGSVPAPVLVQPVGSQAQTVGQLQVDNLAPPLEVTCIESDPSFSNCFLSLTESRAWLFRLGFPQFPSSTAGQNPAFISVGSLQVVRSDSVGWSQCLHDATHICREVTFSQEHVETTVYRMDLAGQGATPTMVHTFPQETVFWLGEGENGEELVLGRGTWDITVRARPDVFYQTGSPFFGQISIPNTCEIEYRDRTSFATMIGSPVSSDNCDFGGLSSASLGAGAGTISPSIRAQPGRRGGAVDFRLPILESTTLGQAQVATRRP